MTGRFSQTTHLKISNHFAELEELIIKMNTVCG